MGLLKPREWLRLRRRQKPDAWFDFDDAANWVDHDDDLGLAYYLTSPDRNDWEGDDKYAHIDPAEDVPEEPHVGLLDFDDIRNPDTGDVAPVAADLLEKLAGTFCEWSPSGTGAHALGGFCLPDGVNALTIDLSTPEWPDAELEIYPGRRYFTITGNHIPDTATSTRDIHDIVEELLATNPGALEATRAAPPAGRPDQFTTEPSTSKEALAYIETTSDIQDVFDAIQHTGPGDTHLRSTVTRERCDGSKDLNPSWAQSKSGTPLAEVGDGWVYRKGMQGLDALQVVALEEHLITAVTDYPSGESFWKAVDALRDRGAHIPKYESNANEEVSALPLGKLDALDGDQRERAAASRDIEWPSTGEARDRLRNRLLDDVRHQEEVVIDAPTGLGKSYAVSTEPWLNHADATGNQPVIHLSPTRDSRKSAVEHSRQASGVTYRVLRGRKEACPVAHGTHDPSEKEDDTARFFTVTGDHVDVTPMRVARRQDALVAIHREYVEESKSDSAIEADCSGAAGGESGPRVDVDLNDQELLRKARNASNGAKFARLWNGNTSGYASHSEADMALCCLLAFWTGGEAGRMEQLFQQSGLMREKWDAVHYADGSTYGEKTIERAVATTSEFYEPASATESEPESGSMGTGGDVGAGAERSRVYLVEKIRMLRERIATLEATLADKTERIDALETQLEQVETTQTARTDADASTHSGAESPQASAGDEAESESSSLLGRTKRFLSGTVE
ncbi:hypothetical protein [Haladaptatus sp. QDMS2]|uniref:phage NrS-1 polymerase family protein n=1 Tax=Haladaptatus sp. QDMS2 TaxID=3033391 RepID=UPI0023E8A8C6|nr:hypothetical protein [Haladaptatus sp. QDMS2]